MAKATPTSEEARSAIAILEKAILDDADSARAPWERGKPYEDGNQPIWRPCRWTLRYQPVRRPNVGFIWAMETTEQQVWAYTYTSPDGTTMTMVTHHGHERHIADSKFPFHRSILFEDYFSWETRYNKVVVEV